MIFFSDGRNKATKDDSEYVSADSDHEGGESSGSDYEHVNSEPKARFSLPAYCGRPPAAGEMMLQTYFNTCHFHPFINCLAASNVLLCLRCTQIGFRN